MINARVLELSEQERIARYLNEEKVIPTFIAGSERKKIPLEGFSDLFLYNHEKKQGILPANGYSFPIEAILSIHDTGDETLLNIKLSMATIF